MDTPKHDRLDCAHNFKARPLNKKVMRHLSPVINLGRYLDSNFYQGMNYELRSNYIQGEHVLGFLNFLLLTK